MTSFTRRTFGKSLVGVSLPLILPSRLSDRERELLTELRSLRSAS